MPRKIETSEHKLCRQCVVTKPRTAEFWRVKEGKYFWSPCLVCLHDTFIRTTEERTKRRRDNRRAKSFLKPSKIMTSDKPVAIYALIDINGNPRYVGKSVMPVIRFKDHQKNLSWAYAMNILEWTTQELWPQRERFWIASLRGAGCTLSNKADGGAGPNGWKMPPEAIAKWVATRYKNGWTISETHKAALIKANTGRVNSPESIIRMKNAAINRKKKEERRN